MEDGNLSRQCIVKCITSNKIRAETDQGSRYFCLPVLFWNSRQEKVSPYTDFWTMFWKGQNQRGNNWKTRKKLITSPDSLLLLDRLICKETLMHLLSLQFNSILYFTLYRAFTFELDFIWVDVFYVAGTALVTTGLWLVLTCIILTVSTSQGKYI